ncbi:PTH11-like integral membrane protein [Aspergillus campestris IBT 28561]|uniref:PTH11-like integral membrane protein n=1 Tax=Aspergillus campestris (strain IBT 28561) TaxID=1392248 RepID=A0A2I1D1D7_ASPC2|nr:PTH11-like integral membrane protein [Aspergillus campestris IBT 28561]PKY03689.1 PTH11-like integral membrane protein [Aspergillus campestris IBT 28561]
MDGHILHTFIPRGSNDDAHGHRAVVVAGVLTALSVLVVGMRMWARLGVMKLMGREDYTILVSLALAICYFGLVCAEVHFGLGQPDDTLSPRELKLQLKSLWASIPLYNASLGFTKFSILFQYLRIFPEKRFRLACWAVLGIVALYTTWAVLSGYVNCVPVAKFWDREIPGGCLNFEIVWFFNASMNIVTDVALFILPMPLLSRLQLPRMQKVGLMAVFAIGILVVITSILRLQSLREVARATDTSKSNVGAAYWTAAECNVAIICACLPFLRPLISRFFPKLLSTRSYNHYNDTTTRNKTGVSRSRPRMELFSQDRDFGMCTIDVDVKSGEGHSNPASGIEVTTTMMQESSGGREDSSQRRLVLGV